MSTDDPARTRRTRRSGRTRLTVAALACLVALAACGEDPAAGPTAASSPEPDPTDPADRSSPGPDAPAPRDADDDPPDPPDPAGTTTDADVAVEADEVTVWYARQSDTGVWLEPRTVRLDQATTAVLRAAIEAVLRGQSEHPDLTTLAPPGTEVRDVAIADRVAVVDLSADVAHAGGGPASERAFAQQLAQTATQFATVDAVRLLVDGQPVDQLWGHVDWSEPLTADPAAIAPIILTEPTWGATLPAGPVTASGTSVTFESTVELRLVAPDGTVVEDTFTTAAQPGAGRRGPWSHTFDAQATTPGTWTVEAVEPDPSGGEGRPAFTTSVEFTVR